MTLDGAEILIERTLRKSWHTGFSKRENIPRVTKEITKILMQYHVLQIIGSNVDEEK